MLSLCASWPPPTHGSSVGPSSWLAAGLVFAPLLHATTVEEAQALLLKGDYAGALTAAATGAHDQPEETAWPLLQVQALNAVGRYQEARAVLRSRHRALAQFPATPARLLSIRCAFWGRSTRRANQLAELDRLGGARSWRYRSPEDRVALGPGPRCGSAPIRRRCWTPFSIRSARRSRIFRDTYLVSGESGPEQKRLRPGGQESSARRSRNFGEDPDIWFGLARGLCPERFRGGAECARADAEVQPEPSPSARFAHRRSIDRRGKLRRRRQGTGEGADDQSASRRGARLSGRAGAFCRWMRRPRPRNAPRR